VIVKKFALLFLVLPIHAFAANAVRHEIGEPVAQALEAARSGDYKAARVELSEAAAVPNPNATEAAVIAHAKQYVIAKARGQTTSLVP
jgi:hypothetical protein